MFIILIVNSNGFDPSGWLKKRRRSEYFMTWRLSGNNSILNNTARRFTPSSQWARKVIHPPW